jgi:hypothetical protein
MKASSLVQLLQGLIAEHGDLEIAIDHEGYLEPVDAPVVFSTWRDDMNLRGMRLPVFVLP